MPSPRTDTVLGSWQDFEAKCFKKGQKIPPAQYKLFKACFYAGVFSNISMTSKYKALTSEEQDKQIDALMRESMEFFLEVIGSMDGEGFLVS